METIVTEPAPAVTPTTTPTVIRIEQNPVQDYLDMMINAVNRDRWCTGSYKTVGGQMCALGMVVYPSWL